MSKGKKGLGLIGLCLSMALALMAFGASAAQAAGCTAAAPTLKPCWMIGGANVTAEKVVTLVAKPEPLGEKKEEHVVLLSTVGTTNTPISILCTKIEAVGEKILAEGVAHGEVKFSTCETFLNGVLSAVCKPEEPIVAKGLLLIALHEGKTYVLAEPEAGKPFTTIKYPDEECALPDAPITGQLWIEDCNGKAEEELSVHLIQEGKAAGAALGGLFYGGHAATIDGSVNLELLEAGVSKKFSVLAA
jgi:hypothetical protein